MSWWARPDPPKDPESGEITLVDATALVELETWCRANGIPAAIIGRLSDLATYDENKVRSIADALAEQGYAWTANEIRARWRR